MVLEGGHLRRDLTSFVVGSSVLCAGITILYVGLAWRETRTSAFPFEKFALGIAVLYGIYNIILNRFALLLPQSPKQSLQYTLLMIGGGALFGLGLSFLGSKVMKVPQKLGAFGYPGKPWLPLVTAWLLYALIWGVVVNLVNRGVGLYPVSVAP